MSSSISRRLVLWLAVPLMLLGLLSALAHYFNSVAPNIISSDRRLKESANALMARVQIKNGQITFDAASIAAPSMPSADLVTYAVRDSQGRLIAGNALLPVVSISANTSQLIALSQVNHRTVRTLSARFDTAGGPVVISVADLHLAAGPAARFNLMSTLLWDFVELDITLALVWVGIYLGLRPMKRLRDDIAARSPEDLRAIDETTVPREIATVIVTLNRLFSRLRSSVQSQQFFIANTAHQLRTPLTGLQAQLDLLLAESAAAPIRQRLLTLQEGIRQLAHSSNQLLSLARADPTVNLSSKNQRLDLPALVGEVVAKFFDRALQSAIDLGVDVEPATIVADPALIDDLLSNLVDNALKYTKAGGRVTVSVAAKSGRVMLAVEDNGPGILAADRQRVLQRFYRLPNSPGHGSGLGLAIVDEIAQLYGASLVIAGVDGSTGTRVTLQFADSALINRG